jgi:hypothetical protein
VAGGLLVAVLGGSMSLLVTACAYLIPVDPRANPIVHHGLFLIMGAFFLGTSVYLLLAVTRCIGLRVFHHKGGLAIRRGERISILPWNEIDIVWRKVKSVTTSLEDKLGAVLDGSECVYTLQAKNFEQFVLDSYMPGVESLGQEIEHETLQHLLSVARKTYDVEGKVEFGRLAVAREGLVKGNKILPWNELGCVTVENGFVFARKPNGGLAWFGVRMGKVPNLHVFQALVASLPGGTAAQRIS